MPVRAVPFGKYHLLDRVNVGGMAEVYKAKMVGVEGFEKYLAIKRILPAIAADQDFINMFIDEAKISVQLGHANIAQIFELGRIDDTYYIALEYVPGRDLRILLERLRRRGEVLPVELACYVMSRVAEGLDYAHRKRDAQGRALGIIHRDISPQNILVSYEGEIKIIDFGIAKAANKILKTQAGILKGKFSYMSPEQVRGLVIDARSDIFAAGIVLYELLVGERLFSGESDYSILEKVRAAQVPKLSGVRAGLPEALERIVRKALAKDPDERYQHASEMVADLQRFLLSQERLFTREDLAAYMKSTFAEEWEREKASMVEPLFGDDEPTPLSDPGASMALVRSPLRPPPVREDEEPRLSSRLKRPSLASAVRAAETERNDVGRRIADEDDDEATRTDTATGPAGGLTPTPLARRSQPLPAQAHHPLTDEPTRVQKAPGPSRSPTQADAPLRVPVAITDNLPQVRRAASPLFDDAEDEPTITAQSARRELGLGPPPSRDARIPVAEVYKPRRRTNWTVVPVAVLLALAAGFVVLQMLDPGHNPVKTMERVGDALADPTINYASLSIETDPPDAEILIGGKIVKPGGAKPFLTERLQTGIEHEILVRKSGFDEVSERVTLAVGERRELSLKLNSAGPVLTIRSDPPSARVFIDGVESGKTPASIALLPKGKHLVRVEQKCFSPVEKAVNLASSDVQVDLVLKPMPGACVAPVRQTVRAAEPGRLRLMSRPAARVHVDGVDTGRSTPLIDYPLSPGKHTIRLVTDQKASEEFEVEIESGRPFTKHLVIGGSR